MPDTFAGGYQARSWSLSDGQTLEWRADLVGLNQGADAADIECVNAAFNGAYVFVKGRDFIHLNKVTFGAGWNIGHVFHEMALIPNTNVVLAFAQTRASPNLILTLRILDKANHNAVLYQRSVVDTPNVTPSPRREPTPRPACR
jgi:hypothetical protein